MEDDKKWLNSDGRICVNTAFDTKYEAYSKGPGFIVSVIRDGKSIYAKGFGRTSLKDNRQNFEIDDCSIFNIASLSKQFTAMGILFLEQENQIHPDNLISNYIPEIPEYMKNIKVRHLLYHTSGLPDYMEPTVKDGKIDNLDVLEVLFKKDDLLFKAGTKFEYSNTGYVILSEIIQRISGESFPHFIEENIFKPLKMKDSFIYSDEKASQLAIGYEEWPFLSENIDSPYNYNFGDGGVCTSIRDYFKWIHFLENPISFLHPNFAEKIFKKGRTDLGDEVNYSYGWGFSHYCGHDFVAHSGTWLGYKSFACFSQERDLWVIIFSNYRGLLIERVVSDYLDNFLS